MLWALGIAFTFVLIGVVIGIVVSVFIGASYLFFCTPYLCWFSDHCPPDNFRNAFRYYKSLITRKPPVLL